MTNALGRDTWPQSQPLLSPAVTETSSRAARSPWPLYLIFFVSGCAGLVYEVMWTRSFGLVFGSSTRAVSVVLAAFFLGMGVGNWIGGRFAVTSRAAALRSYAWVEVAVAAAALLVLGWLALYQQSYPALYRATDDAPAALAAIQLALAALALGPPCIGMGATLPLMSRAVLASEAQLGRRLGSVYALNTFGGVVGVLLSGFWLPVALGVRGSMALAAALNLLAAGAALASARGLDAAVAPAREPAAQGPASLRGAALPLALVAAASGLGTLALEVLFTRLLVNVMDSSVFSFALVLATFLVSLALGAALVSALVDGLRSPWWLVAAGATLGAASILLAPALCSAIWLRASEAPLLPGPLGAALLLVPVALAVIGPPALLVGTLLPSVWRAAIARVETAGALVGRLTSLNTLAAVAGSLFTGFVAIPRFGVGPSFLAVGALYGAVAVLALLRCGRSRAIRASALAVALGWLGLASLGTWEITPLVLRQGEKLIAIDEGEGATVTVVENARGVRSLRVNSRYMLGSSNGVAANRAQGELPLALHGAPREVAFIGLATGMSLSSIQSQPSVERALAMELLPGVARLADAFRDENGGVLEDPRVEIRLADGRNHLFGTEWRFDAIVGDLFVPWHAGTGYLYTVEHFANVRERLREGGVFAQWLQVDQASLSELKSLAASFTAVFEDAELWLSRIEPRRPLLAFVGFRSRASTSRSPQRVGEMVRICGADVLREWSRNARRNTDDFPVIEFSAAAGRYEPTASKLRPVMQALVRLRSEEDDRFTRGRDVSRSP
jgi:spermidine synthase